MSLLVHPPRNGAQGGLGKQCVLSISHEVMDKEEDRKKGRKEDSRFESSKVECTEEDDIEKEVQTEPHKLLVLRDCEKNEEGNRVKNNDEGKNHKESSDDKVQKEEEGKEGEEENMRRLDYCEGTS